MCETKCLEKVSKKPFPKLSAPLLIARFGAFLFLLMQTSYKGGDASVNPLNMGPEKMESRSNSSSRDKNTHSVSELIEYILKKCKGKGIEVRVTQPEEGTSKIILNPSRELVERYLQHQESLKKKKA